MNIRTIEIEKLFGTFNHRIDLKTDDRMTIIHGPNGVGKTITLRMLNALFNLSFGIFQTIPFNIFKVTFTDASYLMIRKETGSIKEPDKITISSSLANEEHFNLSSRIRRIYPHMLQFIEDTVPEIVQIAPNQWLDKYTGQRFTPNTLIDKYEDMLAQAFPNRALSQIPKWLKVIPERFPIGFITTDRLYIKKSMSRFRTRVENSEDRLLSVVEFSQDLARTIREILAQSFQFSSSLDNSFPARLVHAMRESTEGFTEETIKEELKQLEEKRERLARAGLLDLNRDKLELFELGFNESTKKVLSVYLNDTKKKLDFFDEFLSKIELFQSILGKRLNYKTIKISQAEGFKINTKSNRDLSPDALSSGEQHELVLLYELLFKVKKNSFILIDEPEISLHIEWQREFLSDLAEITRVSGFNVLIATHSPDIISDRWDLTVDMGESNA